ncbi:MAG: mandelate racemase/muconate lactonizing enzyme family protein [Hyphomicrobiaceae bacterium]
MKIRSVEVIPLRIPFNDGSAGVGLMPSKWTHLDIALVRAETEDGVIGWGDAFAYSCASASCAAIRDLVAPLVVGREIEPTPEAIAAVNLDLQRKTHLQGRYGITTFAISAIDIALWDLAGKTSGQSIANMIIAASDPSRGTGKRAKLPAYASLVRYTDPGAVRDFAAQSVEEGYRTVKLHEITAAAITAGREAVGPEIRLTTDVNCGWSSDETHRMLPLMKDLDLYWVEEPLFPPDREDAFADLEARYGVAIASGENACTSVEFARTIPHLTFPQPSVTKVGGISEFLRICDLALAHGKTIMPHAPYFGAGYWATIQIMAARPECGLFERFYLWPEAWIDPNIPLPVNGEIMVPTEPGLGLEPDPDCLKRYRAGI